MAFISTIRHTVLLKEQRTSFDQKAFLCFFSHFYFFFFAFPRRNGKEIHFINRSFVALWICCKIDDYQRFSINNWNEWNGTEKRKDEGEDLKEKGKGIKNMNELKTKWNLMELSCLTRLYTLFNIRCSFIMKPSFQFLLLHAIGCKTRDEILNKTRKKMKNLIWIANHFQKIIAHNSCHHRPTIFAKINNSLRKANEMNDIHNRFSRIEKERSICSCWDVCVFYENSKNSLLYARIINQCDNLFKSWPRK